VFTRTLRIASSSKPLALLVGELADGTGTIARDGAVLTHGDDAICAGATALPAGAAWTADGGRLVLKLPALSAPLSVRIALARAKDAAALAPALAGAPADPTALTKGGGARWKDSVTTAGSLGKGDADYVVDTVTLPEANPWNSWMRPSGLDFFADGRAAVCTWSGDVWIVSGLDDQLGHLVWKRFASGLFQPLGLKIVDDQVYVLCHGPIMRLHDLDNDGEADFYECFNNDCAVTNSYHEFACDLQTDSQGNFYFTKGAPALVGREKFERYTAHHGTLLKVSKDGSRLEVVASGFREPNGLCVGPGDLITVTDNQGNWQPGCPIDLIRPGGFYGMPDPASTAPRPQRDPPLCWLPYGMDNSSGSQVWVTSDRWGPLKGQMLLTSYGKCALYSVMMDPPPSTGTRPAQCAVVKLPLDFASGIMRARFSPRDGQLYVCGLRGWGTAAGKDGALQRVRYTGKPVRQPVGFHVAAGGLELRFSCALDPASAADAGNYAAEWFTMVESKAYGSPEFNVSDPTKKGREPLPIQSAKLSADGRTVTLGIAGLKPVMGLVLKLRIAAADGTALTQEVATTINQIPK
jgi:glucose/arabinose dehydrogenase